MTFLGGGDVEGEGKEFLGHCLRLSQNFPHAPNAVVVAQERLYATDKDLAPGAN